MIEANRRGAANRRRRRSALLLVAALLLAAILRCTLQVAAGRRQMQRAWGWPAQVLLASDFAAATALYRRVNYRHDGIGVGVWWRNSLLHGPQVSQVLPHPDLPFARRATAVMQAGRTPEEAAVAAVASCFGLAPTDIASAERGSGTAPVPRVLVGLRDQPSFLMPWYRVALMPSAATCNLRGGLHVKQEPASRR